MEDQFCSFVKTTRNKLSKYSEIFNEEDKMFFNIPITK